MENGSWKVESMKTEHNNTTHISQIKRRRLDASNSPGINSEAMIPYFYAFENILFYIFEVKVGIQVFQKAHHQFSHVFNVRFTGSFHRGMHIF